MRLLYAASLCCFTAALKQQSSSISFEISSKAAVKQQ
jgi:hypothetical protein